MSKFSLFGAVLAASIAVAVPALAQEAISEPGNFAFFHPNADVLDAGRHGDAMASQTMRDNSDVAALRMSVKPRRVTAGRNASDRRY
jgi:hypothetical protein